MAKPGPKKGTPKPPGSGRKKGSLNAASVMVRELANKLGCNSVEITMRFAMGDWKGLGYDKPTETRQNAFGNTYEVPIITPQMRLLAATELNPLMAPTLKSIEVKDPDGNANKPIIVYETKWRELESDDAEGDT